MSLAGYRRADDHSDSLPQPEVLGAGEGDRDDRHTGLDREVCEPLVKREQLTLGLAVAALGKDRHRAAQLQAAIYVAVQRLVTRSLADDWHVAAGGAHQPPLELAGDQDRRVGQEVQPGLDREEVEEGELVEPVQMVGDDDVVAPARPGDVLAALHLESETQAQQGHADQADETVREVGARTYR